MESDGEDSAALAGATGEHDHRNGPLGNHITLMVATASFRLLRSALDQEVLHDKRSRDNFIMEPGDSIVVENFKPYVRVVGAVNSPTEVAYVRGASLEYYVSPAGGPTENANYQRSFVRQPNGSVESHRRVLFFPTRTLVPKAGATVVVPAKNPAQKSDYASLATALTPLIATALTIITVLIRR